MIRYHYRLPFQSRLPEIFLMKPYRRVKTVLKSDPLIAVVIFIGCLLWFWSFTQGMSLGSRLTGEEVSASIRDPLFLSLRTQHNCYATNVGAHLLYLFALEWIPGKGLFWTRFFKSIVLAGGPPLLYVISRQMLLLNTFSSMIVAVSFATLPGYLAWVWLATEFGIDVVFGLAGLYLATKPQLYLRLGSWVFIGASMLIYGGGLTFAFGMVIFMLADFFHRLPHQESKSRFVSRKLGEWTVGASLCGSLLALGISLYQNSQRAMRGGGMIDFGGGAWSRYGDRLMELVRDLISFHQHSYYFFSTLPALGYPVLSAVAALGLAAFFLSGRLSPVRWLWGAIAIGALGITTVVGGVPGYRRVVVLAAVHALGLGLFSENLRGTVSFGPFQTNAGSLVRWMLLMMALVTGIVAWRDQDDVKNDLPIDYYFPDDFWNQKDGEQNLKNEPHPASLTRPDAMRYLSLMAAYKWRHLDGLSSQEREGEKQKLLQSLKDYYTTNDKERYIECP